MNNAKYCQECFDGRFFDCVRDVKFPIPMQNILMRVIQTDATLATRNT